MVGLPATTGILIIGYFYLKNASQDEGTEKLNVRKKGNST